MPYKEDNKKYSENNKDKKKEYDKIYRENNKEYFVKYRKNNIEKILEKSKEYYDEIKEKIQEYNKEYHEENKEILSEKSKIYRENNKEKIAIKNKEWRNNNKEYMKNYKKCRSCKLFQTSKKTNWLCSYCNPDKPDFIKKREVELKLFLKENNYEFEYNKICRYQDKWYYPDFKIKCENYWIIIECDEKAHRDYDKEDEKERENNICLGLNLPCIFLRFNPDTGFKKKIKMKTKQKVLKSYIEYYKNKHVCEHSFEVCYLFY